MTQSYKIALYPGDGIGKEVLDAAWDVAQHAAAIDGTFTLQAEKFNWGCDYYQRHGIVAPPEILSILQPFDAILLGAVGYPEKLPDALTLEPLIQIRQGYDLYANVRPAKRYDAVPSPLASSAPIDIVIVRENSEGEYVTCGGRFKRSTPDEYAVQTSLHSRKGVERILRYGFELAKHRKNKLTMITKSNALRYSMTLWDDVWEMLQPEYPKVVTDKQHVDAASMNLVRRPESFDVIVASNLFGDILSDLAGAVVGGLGLLPSANLNPQSTSPNLFEPVHGSAPDIVGKGLANPVAAILSAAMMLDEFHLSRAVQSIRNAVTDVLQNGQTTPDLGGSLTTVQMAEAILKAMK